MLRYLDIENFTLVLKVIEVVCNEVVVCVF